MLYSPAILLALIGALLILGIYLLFLHLGASGIWFYTRFSYASLAALGLFVRTILFRTQQKPVAMASELSSVLSFVVACPILIGVVRAAGGNNDAGEFFWFIALPMICLMPHIWISTVQFYEFCSTR
jgi:hypothetical protein